jgi:hypothetical protein
MSRLSAFIPRWPGLPGLGAIRRLLLVSDPGLSPAQLGRIALALTLVALVLAFVAIGLAAGIAGDLALRRSHPSLDARIIAATQDGSPTRAGLPYLLDLEVTLPDGRAFRQRPPIRLHVPRPGLFAPYPELAPGGTVRVLMIAGPPRRLVAVDTLRGLWPDSALVAVCAILALVALRVAVSAMVAAERRGG